MKSYFYPQIYRLEDNYWWYKSRRRLVMSLLPRHHHLKLLDIGCGTGKLMEELQPYGSVYGIDVSPQAIKFCRRRRLHHVYQDDFPRLKNLRQKNFDVIFCLDVLEHIAADDQAVQKIKQLLAPHGRLILTVPAYPWLFSYWDKMSGHHRRYSSAQLVRLLNHSGLKLIKISYLYSFLLPIAIPFRLIKHRLFKHHGAPQSDLVKLAGPANLILFILASLERILLKRINLPFGLSLLCVAEK